MGPLTELRDSIRAGTDIRAFGLRQESFEVFLGEPRSKGLTAALQARDAPFGDYRTADGSRAARLPLSRC